ncbi:MAG: RHS repeat-associated core domain-containing protein [Lachnospiraceae bacterium]
MKHYTYDNSGNMLSDGEMSYLYDGFGRLEQVTKVDGSFQKNHYDAEGLRAEMEENGQLVKFLYNEDREAAAEEESDGNVIRYIRGLGLISSDSEKAKTYYHYVSDEQGSITHVINGEEKESGELPQEDVQSRVLNHYEYDAFGNTIRCEEQVHNRFRYTGEQYDPITQQYYLRARYYNPVIGRFIQEDTYYGDGLNLYTYCQNNPILYHDPTGHGTKENSPYSRNEQQYIDAGADPDTAKLATQCYPDAKSKQDLYNKYKSQGYNATDAKKLANYEIVHGEERAKNYAANNVKKSGPDYTVTSPRDNINTDWRTQNRLNAQKKAGAGKSGSSSIVEIVDEEKGTFIIKDWSDYPDDYVPVPDQNKVWTFLEGDEYNSARDSANIFNRNMRAADPYYANNGLEIHEIEPVKMGGSPTDINNKTAIQSQVHRRYVTPWWNKIRDEVKKGLN